MRIVPLYMRSEARDRADRGSRKWTEPETSHDLADTLLALIPYNVPPNVMVAFVLVLAFYLTMDRPLLWPSDDTRETGSGGPQGVMLQPD